MIKKRLFLWLLPALLLTGCSYWDSTNNTGTTDTNNQENTGQTNEIDEEKQRNEEEADLRQDLTDLTARLNAAKAKEAAAGTTTSSALQPLNQLQASIQADLNNLQTATGTLWENAKDRIQNSLDEFENQLEDYEDQVEEAQDNATQN